MNVMKGPYSVLRDDSGKRSVVISKDGPVEMRQFDTPDESLCDLLNRVHRHAIYQFREVYCSAERLSHALAMAEQRLGRARKTHSLIEEYDEIKKRLGLNKTLNDWENL